MQDVQAKAAKPGRVILLSPGGAKFDQAKARELASLDRIVFICGHYEGVDERVREHLVEDEISIGDFILTNGALAALVVIDAVVRLLPNVVGNEASTQCRNLSAPSVPGSKARSTRGPRNSAAGACRRFCFPVITAKSRNGATSKAAA